MTAALAPHAATELLAGALPEVLGELPGESAQDAADDELLLDGEVAAVAVGHPLEPAMDDGDVAVVARAGLDALEPSGDLAGADLARLALPAGLDRRNRENR